MKEDSAPARSLCMNLTFTGVGLFSAGMTLFITGLMWLALARDARRANVVEPALRSDIGVPNPTSTGVTLFSAAMTLSITGAVRFITGLMRLALTRMLFVVNVVEPLNLL